MITKRSHTKYRLAIIILPAVILNETDLGILVLVFYQRENRQNNQQPLHIMESLNPSNNLANKVINH